MASTPDVIGRNNITLRSTELLLEDIHERAPDWDQRPDGERADITYEWEAMVDRLHGVIEDDITGTLTTEQQKRLRELARELVRSRETILRIGLDYPDLGHLLAIVPMTPEERMAHEINSLQWWAGRLRMMGDFWDSPLLNVRERHAFPREWDNVMDRFANVEARAAGGALTLAARAELRRVADELDELLPTMRRIDVRLPDLEALERARGVEAA